jgi:hypothetical protein
MFNQHFGKVLFSNMSESEHYTESEENDTEENLENEVPGVGNSDGEEQSEKEKVPSPRTPRSSVSFGKDVFLFFVFVFFFFFFFFFSSKDLLARLKNELEEVRETKYDKSLQKAMLEAKLLPSVEVRMFCVLVFVWSCSVRMRSVCDEIFSLFIVELIKLGSGQCSFGSKEGLDWVP